MTDDGGMSWETKKRRISEHLSRTIRRMSIPQLRQECLNQGFDDLLLNKAVSTNRSCLMEATLQRLLAPWEVNDDEPETVDAWLACCADPWPECEHRPQPDLSEPSDRCRVMDCGGEWGLEACGVEVRECVDAPSKGRGAFATRRIERGHVVGVYAGELLEQREHALRHAERGPLFLPPDEAEEAALEARRSRLEALAAAEGAPMGGASNHGGYAFALLPDVHSQQFPGRKAVYHACGTPLERLVPLLLVSLLPKAPSSQLSAAIFTCRVCLVALRSGSTPRTRT